MEMSANTEQLRKVHGCHSCGEENEPRIVAGVMTCPDCGSTDLVCLEDSND
jgi:ribosomal protein L37AE/L43A